MSNKSNLRNGLFWLLLGSIGVGRSGQQELEAAHHTASAVRKKGMQGAGVCVYVCVRVCACACVGV